MSERKDRINADRCRQIPKSSLMYGDIIPERGKRYSIMARPWDVSYLYVIENKNGNWLYDPTSEEVSDEN